MPDAAKSWKKFYAPVTPPTWIVQKVKGTGEAVDWNNSVKVNGVVCPMLYRTERTDKLGSGIVTLLLPGSCRPAEGWLRKLPP